MIQVQIVTNQKRCLQYLYAYGHAEDHINDRKKQFSIVCAAFTMLVRTVARAIEQNDTIEIDGNAEKEGSIHFRIIQRSAENNEWLQGVSDCLITGLYDLRAEYPDYIKIEMTMAND